MIKWIRFKHRIPCQPIKADNEFTVAQVQQMFGVSNHMVYYWIERKYIEARKMPDNSFLITITSQCKKQLKQMMATSHKASTMTHYPAKNKQG